MSTDKYEFGNVSIGTTGWNGIMDNNIELFDLHLHTRLEVTLEQTVGEGNAICLGPGALGRLARAGAGSDRKPSIGLAIESGVPTDEIRVQRVGPFTSTSLTFSKIGRPVYLHTVQGQLTQTRPANDIQFMGIATDTDTILLGGNIMVEDYQVPSTTTTTTSTTSTTTTVTTTTSTSTTSTSTSTTTSTTTTTTT